MKSIILSIFLLLVCSVSWANQSYLSMCIGKEIYVYMNSGKCKGYSELLMRVKEVDEVNNLLIGQGNTGIYYIELNKIQYIKEQQPNIKGIFVN